MCRSATNVAHAIGAAADVATHVAESVHVAAREFTATSAESS